MAMTKVSSLVSKDIANFLTNKQTWGGIIFNVKAFGAKGDGTTGDTAAIQAAITAASVAGGGVVYFPPGSYLINSGLTVPDKVYIRGSGIEVTKILAGANAITMFSLTRAVLTNSFAGISEMTLNVNSKTTIKGITTTLASQIEFSNLRFTGDFTNTFLCDRGRGVYIDTIISDDGPALFTDTTGSDRLFELQIKSWSVMGFATSSVMLHLRRVVNATISEFITRDLQGTCDGIQIDDLCEGILINQPIIVHPRYGITAIPNGANRPWYVTVNNGMIDQPKAGGMTIDADQVSVSYVAFVGGAQRTNTDHIVTIRSTATNSEVNNCSFWDNLNNGINVEAGALKFDIVGNRIGTQVGTAINVVVGASNDYRIVNNDVRDSNGGTIVDGGTGTNKQIFGNIPSGTYDFFSLGGGTALKRHLTTTAVMDFGPVGANTSFDIDVPLTGAAVGDTVAIGVAPASVVAGIAYTAWVNSANTVRVRCTNATTASVDPASGTFRVSVWKY